MYTCQLRTRIRNTAPKSIDVLLVLRILFLTRDLRLLTVTLSVVSNLTINCRHSCSYMSSVGEALVREMYFSSLLLLKEVGNARLWESYLHPISPTIPDPVYQPIQRKQIKGKQTNKIRKRAAYVNEKALAQLLIAASPTPPNSGSAR